MGSNTTLNPPTSPLLSSKRRSNVSPQTLMHSGRSGGVVAVQRCDRDVCIAARKVRAGVVKRALKAEHALKVERATRRKLVDDEGRRDYALPYNKMCEEVESLVNSNGQLQKKNTAYAKLIRELQDEKASLIRRVDTVTTARASLAGKLASHARRDAVEARASSQAERQRLAATAASERNMAVAISVATGKAAAAVSAAEKRAAVAEERAAVVEADAKQKVEAADAAVVEAVEWAAELKAEAEQAREEAVDALAEVEAAVSAKDDALWAEELAMRREARAKAAAEKLSSFRPPVSKTDAEWGELSRDAGYQAAKRDRDYFNHLFTTHNFRMKDLSDVLNKLGLLNALMDSPAMFSVYYSRVQELRVKLEMEDYGIHSGLVLHYDFLLTLALPRSTR